MKNRREKGRSQQRSSPFVRGKQPGHLLPHTSSHQDMDHNQWPEAFIARSHLLTQVGTVPRVQADTSKGMKVDPGRRIELSLRNRIVARVNARNVEQKGTGGENARTENSLLTTGAVRIVPPHRLTNLHVHPLSVASEKAALIRPLSSGSISSELVGASQKRNANGHLAKSQPDIRKTRAIAREIAATQSQEMPLSTRWRKSHDEITNTVPERPESMLSLYKKHGTQVYFAPRFEYGFNLSDEATSLGLLKAGAIIRKALQEDRAPSTIKTYKSELRKFEAIYNSLHIHSGEEQHRSPWTWAMIKHALCKLGDGNLLRLSIATSTLDPSPFPRLRHIDINNDGARNIDSDALLNHFVVERFVHHVYVITLLKYSCSYLCHPCYVSVPCLKSQLAIFPC